MEVSFNNKVMDWHTIIASVTASSIIAAAICYVVKKSFDQALELKVEKIKEQYKATINEEMRRKAFLYDKQFEALKELLSLIYRIRNTIRDLLYALKLRDEKRVGTFWGKFVDYEEILKEMLYRERLTLPAFFFDIAHSMKHHLNEVHMEISFSLRSKINQDKEFAHFYERIESIYKDVDKEYALLASEIQMFFGVAESGAAPNNGMHPTRDTAAHM